MNIDIIVANKIATAVGSPIIVCGNSDYTVTFSFDNEWEEYAAKTARFSYIRDGQLKYVDVPFVGNTCEAPVLSGIKRVGIGVYAGELHTTTGAVIECRKSILCDGGEQDPPEESVYNEIMRLFNTKYVDTSLTPVKQEYDPESDAPISGKGVAQALVEIWGSEIVNFGNLIIDCFGGVAWANTDGNTKLNALKNYIDNIETDEPDTPDEPEEPDTPVDEYEIVRVLGNDEIMHLSGYTEKPPYYSTRDAREVYPHFDIPVEYGYTYKLEWETNCTEKVVIGYQMYNQNVLNSVANNGNFDKNTDCWGFSEWQESGTEWELTETANNLPLVGMRFHFKKENDAAFVSGAGVTSVTIKRKAVA
jgi:hypothetical protein